MRIWPGHRGSTEGIAAALACAVLAFLPILAASPARAACPSCLPRLDWALSYDSPAHSTDIAWDIAVDADRNFVVAGSETRTDLGTGQNWLVRKYGPGGNLLWSRTHNGPANGEDAARSVSVDTAGNVVVAGYETRTGQGRNWLVRKYDPAGAVLWSRTFNGASNLDDIASDSAVDHLGNVVVGGRELTTAEVEEWRIWKYDTNGNNLWTVTDGNANAEPDAINGIAVDPSGSVYVAGFISRDPSAGTRQALRKYPIAGGAEIWGYGDVGPTKAMHEATAVAIDLDGNAVMAGFEYETAQGANFNVWKIDVDGGELWKSTYSSSGAVDDRALGIAVAGTGEVIAAGGNGDLLIRMLDYSVAATVGACWTLTVAGAAGGDDAGRSVAFTDPGHFLVVGNEDQGPSSNGQDWTIRRYRIGCLDAVVRAFPVTASMDYPILVTVTVTNTGTSAINGVTAEALFRMSGTGSATQDAGPHLAMPAAIAGGASVTWTWTFSGTSSGTMVFATTVTGTDAVSGRAVAIGELVSNPVTMQTPAALSATLVAFASRLSTGQEFLVTVTVSNSGQASAVGVVPGVPWPAGGGDATVSAGPWPVAPMTLPGGATASFTWTMTASVPGSLWFTSTVTGSDANSAAALTTGPLVQDFACTVETAASLEGHVAVPPSVSIGQWFEVSLTMTNAGEAVVAGLAAAAWTPEGAGTIELISGPVPAVPATLAGGSSATFVWTFSASGAGSVRLTATATGVDANSVAALSTGPLTTGAIAVETPTAFSARLLLFPSPRSVGQAFLATLTVTNTGGATATGVDASAFLRIGTVAFTVLDGPEPVLPVSLAGGASATFTWTLTGDSAGILRVTTTVTGLDANSLLPIVRGPVISGAIQIQTPGNLVAAVSVSPQQVSVGQTVTVTITITNTGQASVIGVAPGMPVISGAASAVYATGPTPDPPLSLGTGGKCQYTYTFDITGPGSFVFTTTATGTENNTGALLTTGPAFSAVGLAQVPATLEASVTALPATVGITESILVCMTVTNTGEATANGVTPSAWRVTGSGAAVPDSGPNPAAPVVLGGGSSVTFTWTFTASSVGGVFFSATASGTDANSSLAVSSGAAVSSAVSITGPAGLVCEAFVYPSPVTVGQWFTAALTVSNTGTDAANDVKAVLVDRSTAVLELVEGPVPAGPEVVAGTSGVTFIWTFSASGAGNVAFSLTATGTASVGGAALYTFRDVSLPGGVQTPAALGAAVAFIPAQVSTGQSFLVTVTVTNTGQASASGIVAEIPAVSGSGAAGGATGPWPPATAPLTAGASITFTWTMTAGAPGSAWFTSTVTGADGNSGAALLAGPATSSTCVIHAPAALVARVVVYKDPLCTTRSTLVTLTVTNTGGAPASSASAADFAVSGSGLISKFAGPMPGFPATIPGGGSRTFTWTYTGTTPGMVTLTATVSGTDGYGNWPVTTGAVPSAGVSVGWPGSIAAAGSGPAQVSTGQWFTVSLTATNTGGLAVEGLGATAYLPSAVAFEDGPAGPAALAAGAARTFSWTLSASGAGTAVMTLTAAGTACGDSLAGASAVVTVSVESAARLAAAVATLPAQSSSGQGFLVTVTVTNTGAAAATGVVPGEPALSGTAGATVDAGPWPAAPVTLVGGGAITFTWTLTAGTAGNLWFASTVTGTDGNSGAALSTGCVVQPAAATVQAAAQLAASLAWPATVSVGQVFTLALSVTNTGGATATGVTPAPFLSQGGGAVTVLTGPSPAGPVAIAGGFAQTFVWTVSGTAAGTVRLTDTVTGADLNSGWAVTTGPVTTPALTVEAPAALVGTAVATPATLPEGQAILLVLTLDNTGGTTALGVSPVAPSVAGTGAASPAAGPWPAGPVAIPAGGNAIFTWTFTGTSAGTVELTSTASGTDGNSGWVVTTGPVTAAAVTVTAPAALVSAAAVFPAPVSAGQWVTVTLTVTNTGGTPAQAVAPVLVDGSTAAFTTFSGPLPPSVASLAPGAAQTFAWTLSTAGAGSLSFGLTATGTELGSGNPVFTAATTAGTVQSPAALAASMAVSPMGVPMGRNLLVTLTVTNTGTAGATGVVPAPPFTDGDGAVVLISGPVPAGAVPLAGGASVTFTWTYSGSVVGSVQFTSTAAGTDANSGFAVVSGAATAGPVTIMNSANLVSAAALGPSPVSAGQWITVELTVTNTGGLAAESVTPVLVNGSTAALTAVSGPLPASVASLAAGAAQTFMWTFSTAGAGDLSFGLTATGTEETSGDPVFTEAPVAAAGGVVDPAALSAAVDMLPLQVSGGQSFLVTVTVTNTGEATATGVAPDAPWPSGGGAAGGIAGPWPAAPVTMGGGTSMVFTWTLTAGSAGSLWFTSTVVGTDINSGMAVTSGAVVQPAAGTVQAPAALAASAALLPSRVNTGQAFMLTVTVTNAGGAVATGVVAEAPRAGGAGTASAPVGPTPAGPLSLAGGGSIVFTWTYTGSIPGLVILTTTVTGADGNSAVALATGAVTGTVLVQAPAALVSAVSYTAFPVSIGQWIRVALTVTNTGGATASGVTPALGNWSGAVLETVAAPAAAPIAGGGWAVFEWTLSASGAGAVSLGATATGTDANTGAVVWTSKPLTGSPGVQVPAALAASLVVFPGAVNTGQAFWATLTVTNTGGAEATGVLPAVPDKSGTGTAAVSAGPWPVAPVPLAGGSSVTFTWTMTASTGGLLGLTTTVTGADTNSGAALAVGPVPSGTILIVPPAALAASVAMWPAQVSAGQGFRVTATVWNTGGAAADGVVPGALFVSGTGAVTVVAGPSPSTPVSVPGGSGVVFTWTCTSVSAGSPAFTVTATGTDSNTAAAISTGQVTGSGVVQVPAALAAASALLPSRVNTGQGFMLTVTVTNTGGAAATSVVPAAPEAGGFGTAAQVGGPNPSGPLSISGGGSRVFTWTYTGSIPGLVILTTTVTGADGNSAVALATGPVTGTVLVQAPAALVSAVSYTAFPVSIGQWIRVALTVTNTGGATASGVTPALGNWSGAVLETVAAPAAAPIAGGGWAVFEWTLSASGAGAVSLGATATGTDVNTGAVVWTSKPVTASPGVQVPATLAATVSMLPSPVNQGQSFLLTVTATNTGEVAATGVSPAPPARSGAGTATLGEGPWPAAPVALGAGASITFTWTLTAGTAGSLWYTSTVTGTDANSGRAVTSGPAVQAPSAVQVPAALAASLAIAPDPAGIGGNFLLMLTVTNTGGAAATGVSAAPVFADGAATVSAVAGPNPAFPAVIAGGVSRVFTWTCTGSTLGAVTLSTTVTATDANEGWALSAGPVAADVTISNVASLVSAATILPSPVSAGQWFTVAFTVTNAGGITATGVFPALVNGSTAALVPVSGPVPPGPVSLVPGAGQTFAWTFSAAGAGNLVFALTATGAEAGSGNPLFTSLAAGVPGGVQAPAALAAAVAMYPASVSTGQSFLVTVTVTNTGQASAAGVVPGSPWPAGTGAASVGPGPQPPAPVTLPGGASVTFTWTMTAGTPGSLWFTSTVAGSDSNSGLSVTTGAATQAAAAAVQSPALLAASATLSPSTVSVGQWITLALTVTNTGGAAAAGVNAAAFLPSGAGAVSAIAGPAPALPATIAGGSSQTFLWTFSAAGAGAVALATTVTGTDANAGWPVAPAVAAGGPAAIQTRARLVAAAAMYPMVVSTGQSFLVTVTATNTGQAGATGVSPAAPFPSRAGGAAVAAGPEPAAPVALPGGASVTFTWTMTAGTAGIVSFASTLTGADENSGAGVTSGPAATPPGTVQSAAALAAALSFSPLAAAEGQSFRAMLTVTNTGQAGAASVTAAPFALSGSGSAGPGVGPFPAMPVVLAGGASRVFTWTYTGVTAGSVVFTTTLTAADANSGAAVITGPVAGGPVIVTTPAVLAASAALSPAVASTGQWVAVALTVTNTGGTAATVVVPALVNRSGAVLVPVSGPIPAGPVGIAAGAAQTFVWTFSASGAGTAAFSLTATGTDGGLGTPLFAFADPSWPGAVEAPARLRAAVAMLPLQVSGGQPFLVTVTVTNTGQAAATGVVPAAPFPSRPGGASVSAGPEPVAPVVLAGGASITFTWTMTAGTAGSVSFAATVTGVDGNSGLAVTSGPAAAPVAGSVQSAAVLAASAAISPAQVSEGQSFRLTITVTNTGGATAAGVAPAGPFAAGAGTVSVAAGPSPASAAVAGGAAVTFTWTLSASTAGAFDLTFTVTGSDSNSGGALAAGPVVTAGLVRTPAALAAALTLSATTAEVGNTVVVTAQVTNSGQAAATGVPRPSLRLDGTGGGTPSVLPGGFPATVAGGATVSWSWTVTLSVPGAVSFSLTAAGMDANSGAPVSAFAAAAGPFEATPAPGTPVLTVVSVAADRPVVKPGETVTVAMAVRNDGTAVAVVVAPTVPVVVGGPAAQSSGPSPASVVTLAPGASASFAWTFVPQTEGTTVAFSVGATAANAAASAPVTSAAVEVATTGSKAADVVVTPNPYSPSRDVELRFRRMPPLARVTIFTIAGEPVRRIEGDAFGSASWDGRNDQGAKVVPGIYLFMCEAREGKRFVGKIRVDR